ncbi:putative protein FAM90A20P [Onychomys torridus]|uniref:putative protein FAM90A20P n=1 Tax=Onychomys torridus TaxID=38674 RepID=UPI00167F53FF|nr:putative protein FAM90A20P [Onychomys torridus]XP_036022793.1 putative protein FAM90A20P [Onychomys torridus]
MIDSHSAMSQHKRMLIPDPRDIPAQRDQSQPSGPMALNVPPLQEENPRVKCRDCGAFGHRSRSRRCPIKCGPWHLVPQPLETREEKENQDPHRAQALQNPGTISQAEIDKNLSQHPALHKDRQTPNLSLSAPGKKPAQGPTHPRPNPPKKPRLALCKPQEESSARNDSKASSTESQSQTTIKSLGRREALEKRKNVAGQEPSTGTEQTLVHSNRAASLSGRPPTETQEPFASHVAGQALRMIFTRHHGDFWSSRFMTMDADLPSEKQTSPLKTPASQGKGDGAHLQPQWSVLSEDLHISTTSGDSEEE